MKKLSFLLLILNPCLSAAMPLYETVARYFELTYHFTLPDSLEFRLAKKTDGWHLLTYVKPDENRVIKSELLWKTATGQFTKLSYPKTSQKKESFRIARPSYVDEYCFERCAYYGYKGWELDMIRDFASHPNPTDTMLEGLARAYIQSGLSHLWAQHSYHADYPDCPSSRYNETIAPACINEYIRITKLGLECYRRLADRNMYYKTIVGIMPVKYANEVFYAHHTLSMTGYPISDNDPFLFNGLYSEAILNYGKSFLNSLDSNAIFFTNGDLDTYITLYLQSALGYRKDVTVINLSLLNLPRVSWVLSQGINQYKPLQMQLGPLVHQNSSFDYFFHDERASERNDGLWYISDWIKQLNDSGSTARCYDVNCTYMVVPSKQLQYKVGDKYLEYKLKDYYMFRSDLMLLDVINTNSGKRPVYFSLPTDGATLYPFRNNLWITGMAYKLKADEHDGDEIAVDLEETLRHLHSGLPFYDPESSHLYNHAPFKEAIGNYRYLHVHVANALINEKRNQEADSLLQILEKETPYETCLCDVKCLTVIEAYLNAGNPKKAIELSDRYYKQLTDPAIKSNKLNNEELVIYARYAVSLFEGKQLDDEVKKWNKLAGSGK